MANITLASGGTSSAAGTPTLLTFRSCDDGMICVPTQGDLPPLSTDDQMVLPGSVVYRVEASRERGPKNGTVRVMIRVRIKFPVARISGAGTVSQDQEVTLHTVLTLPASAANMLLGQVHAVDGNTSPYWTTSASIATAIGIMVSLITNQTVDVGAIRTELPLNPLYMGVLGVCPVDREAGSYGTTHVLPPSAG